MGRRFATWIATAGAEPGRYARKMTTVGVGLLGGFML